MMKTIYLKLTFQADFGSSLTVMMKSLIELQNKGDLLAVEIRDGLLRIITFKDKKPKLFVFSFSTFTFVQYSAFQKTENYFG